MRLPAGLMMNMRTIIPCQKTIIYNALDSQWLKELAENDRGAQKKPSKSFRGGRRAAPCKARRTGRMGFELYLGCSFRAAELMQYRKPDGPGPSSNTWPRWPLHFEQSTSVRTMPWLA